MKSKWKYVITVFTMTVLCISVCTTTANAAVVWQDDFENLDDWTIYGYTNLTTPVKTVGNFSAADGTLKVLDDDINVARHNSTTDVGTWYFDMFVPDDDFGAFYVEFLSNGSTCLPALGNSSFVAVGPWLNENKFVVWTMVGSGYQILKNIYVEPIQGWHHIAVRRTSDCRFLVAFNRTLEANFTYYTVTSSTYLQVYCNNVTGAAIDNLVIDDDPEEFLNHVDLHTTTLPPPPWILIAVGGGVAVGVIVLAIIFVRRR